jgi:hypothetical protein
MSTEFTRSGRQASRRFGRVLLATIITLAVLAGVLSVLNATRGPRLQSAALNLENVVTHAGQRLLLQADQSLADVAESQVSVTPSVPFSVAVDGATVTVTFTGILDYNTRYRVQVDPVVGLHQGARSSMEYEFTTRDVDVFTLQRDDRVTDRGTKHPDAIRRETLGGSKASEVVFDAERIQEFVALPDYLAVVTLDEFDAATLLIVSLTDGTDFEVPLPSNTALRSLRTSGSTNVLGFTVSGDFASSEGGSTDTLYTYDFSDGSGVARPVLGINQEPLAISDYIFVPGTTSVVAHDPHEAMYLIDVVGDGDITPLGQHAEMRGFIPGTNLLVVADPTQGSTIDLSSGAVSVLSLPEDDLGDAAPGKLDVLNRDGKYLRLYHAQGSDGSARPLLALTDKDGSRLVYHPAAEGSKIRNFCVSPNGQYAAVETVSQEGQSDGYPSLPAFSAMQTTFVNLADGAAVRSVNGFLPHWCSERS